MSTSGISGGSTGNLRETSIDALLDDIGAFTPKEADSFITGYSHSRRADPYLRWITTWLDTVGPNAAPDIMALVLAFSSTSKSELAEFPYGLLALRYGSCVADRGMEAIREGFRRDWLTASYDNLVPMSSRSAELLALRLERLRAEHSLRLAEMEGRYAEVKEWLDRASALDPIGATHLREEYKHLAAAARADLAAGDSDFVRLQHLHRAIKSSVAPIHVARNTDAGQFNNLILPTRGRPTPRHRPAGREAQDSQQRGSNLEQAAVSLFRNLFKLSNEEADAIAAAVRRQGGGYQFGHDISVTTRTARNDGVRCHFECKNYSGRIRTADIADKLLQQRSASRHAQIDHWILISPHQDPSNDLAELVREWEMNDDWDFSVQIWSPQNGIDELFAISPEVYRAVYDSEPPDVDVSAVLSEFHRRLTPRIRLHRGFLLYLREPWRMCFPTEDAGHFDALAEDHVQLNTVDLTGRPTGRTLNSTIEEWLEESAAPTMLLLGEFGDGKSFFTYMLCRELGELFLSNPDAGRFPVRLSLRELHQAGSAEGLVDRWLSDIGVPRSEWLRLVAQHPTLVILDGFDEMTAELDPPTIDANLRLLARSLQVLAGPATESNLGRKMLLTSRGRFFDQPEEEAALRERLRHPEVVRIRPLTRDETLRHLAEFATRTHAEEQLDRIRLLYDPIGLASKPLFLQMIKDTLDVLPSGNFGAATLYETYIDRSLARKSELLIGREPYELVADTIVRMRQILEAIAVRLHNGGGGSVDLRALESDDESITDLLWRMAMQPSAMDRDINSAHDARMRVSIRSLLRPVPTREVGAWNVDFFHRSMSEYFLALAITRALETHDIRAIRNSLGKNPISRETADFVAERVSSGSRTSDIAARLESVARSATIALQGEDALGGNALSLFYRLTGKVNGKSWSGLRLDHVQLPSADLRGLDFSFSSLRYANLDNADLRNADLSNADLTGLRVERTSQVQAVAIDRDIGAVIGAYSDGAIREWRLADRGRWVPHTVFEGLEGSVRSLLVVTSAIAVALTPSEAWILARTRPAWTVSGRTSLSPFLADISAPLPTRLMSLEACDGFHMSEVDIETGETTYRTVTSVAPINDTTPRNARSGSSVDRTLVSGSWLVLATASVADERGARLIELTTGHEWRLPGKLTPTAFAVQVEDSAKSVTVGTAEGDVLRAAIGSASGVLSFAAVKGGKHEGPVTTVYSFAKGYLATGGNDRRILIWNENDVDAEASVLYLTLRCHGARFDGTQGPAERALLMELAEGDSCD